MTAVAVVTHNSESVIERCLAAVQGTRILVVDNASTDATVGRARSFDGVGVLALDRNVGFGAAANLAIRELADDTLLLNPDVEITAGGIEALENVLRKRQEVGIAAPRLQYPDGSPQASARTFPSPMTMLLRRTFLGRTALGQRQLARHLYSRQLVGEAEVDWVLGAAMLIRWQAFRMVGGFDENFFLYGEDVDLCHRMWSSGWTVRIAADTSFVHEYQRQSARTWDLRDRAVRAHWRSAARLFTKHPGLTIGRPPPRQCR